MGRSGWCGRCTGCPESAGDRRLDLPGGAVRPDEPDCDHGGRAHLPARPSALNRRRLACLDGPEDVFRAISEHGNLSTYVGNLILANLQQQSTPGIECSCLVARPCKAEPDGSETGKWRWR